MQVILQVEPYFQTDTKVVRYLLYILHTAMIDLYIVQEYSEKNHMRENKPVQKKRTTFLFHAANSIGDDRIIKIYFIGPCFSA